MAILFANNAEALMGTVDDPPDGGAVARTCIGAVVIYAVHSSYYYDPLTTGKGIPCLLWMSGIFASAE